LKGKMGQITHDSITVNMGGVDIAFQSDDPGLKLVLVKNYEQFVSSGPAWITLHVHAGAYPNSDSDVPQFESGFLTYYKRANKLVYRSQTRNQAGILINHFASFEKGGQTGDLYFEEVDNPNPAAAHMLEVPPYLLDGVLEIQFLTFKDGLAVHGCGIQTVNGEGLLFAGVSGAGKSTTARLWQEAGAGVLLSDERVGVVRRDGQFWLCGTPWHGEGQLSTPGNVPLKQIFVISHAGNNQLHVLKRSEAVAALMVRAFLPFWEPQGLDFALEFLDQLCQAVPCYELGFVPDTSAVDFVRCMNVS